MCVCVCVLCGGLVMYNKNTYLEMFSIQAL